MQQVTSFKTADGKLFTDKSEALGHEFDLEIRGFIQSRNNLGNTGAITVAQAATTIAKNCEAFYDLLLTFRRRNSALNRKPTIKPVKPEAGKVIQIA